MKQEFVQVPVELVRELKAACEAVWPPGTMFNDEGKRASEAVRRIPDPPKPDMVEEMTKRLNEKGWYFSTDTVSTIVRIYREFGCPELE